ncbi:MAG: LacI family DNA-binding transcriptional regulator [Ilumatobacteraceae bacterium]
MRRPTLDDVASRVGVSRTLVSLTLRGLAGASDETRDQIIRAAGELGYVPDAAARNLASQSSRAVGVMMRDLHNAFFADVLDGFDRPMRDAGFHMLIGLADQVALERSMLDTFRSYRMAGALLIGPGLRERDIEEFGTSVPTVVVARRLRITAVDMIVGDDRKGARLAVQHLYELGHRDIAHLDGGSLPAAASARRTGYVDAMKRFGLDRFIRMAGGGFTLADGADGVDELLRKRRPTAIFAANDLVAMGAMERLSVLGLSTPGDVSVIGYDNSTLSAQRRVGLTSIAQPLVQIGELAATMLQERHAGRTTASRHVMTPKLVERESTASPRKHSKDARRGSAR